MDITKFSPAMTGELVEITHPKYKHAFVPFSVPEWKVPERLLDTCMEAWGALQAMDGILNTLPNPELLLRPLQEREAHQSSKLEGTDADPAELIVFAQSPRDPTSESDPANRYLEVLNYGSALAVGYESQRQTGLTMGAIREMHKRLLTGVRGQDKKPGEFRNDLVAIGKPAKFIPPPAVFVNELLEDLLRYINRPYVSARESLVRAFIAHYQFETIHPFFDGNGRIGRVILSLMVYAACGHKFPWLYMSPFFERNSDDYTRLLLRVSTHGEWEAWIEFCLRGAIEQAGDAISRCKLLQAIRERYVEMSRPIASARTIPIIDGFFASPLVRVGDIKKTYGVYYNTAKSDIESLVKIGILRRLISPKRPASYYAWEFFRVTYEDHPRMATPAEYAEAIALADAPREEPTGAGEDEPTS